MTRQKNGWRMKRHLVAVGLILAGRARGKRGCRFQLVFYAVLALIALGATQAVAQDVSESELTTGITVGVYVSPPFVEDRGEGQYSGIAIELWEIVAERLGLDFHYAKYPTFRDLVRATAENEVDAAVTNLTITRDRAEDIAFTQPWYDAGLRIMVPDQGGGGFWGVVGGLQDAGHLKAYAWLLSIIAFATIALTLFDRRFDPDFPRLWREGVAESFYHVMLAVTSKRIARKNLFGWVGRFWQAIWLAVGVVIIAYITSSVTSVMTTVSLTRGITALSDLPGKTIGVFTGSAAEKYLQELGISTRSFPNIDVSVNALQEGRVDAIVGDAPILEHYAHTHFEERLEVVGNLFHPDKYGFAFPHESSLTLPITLQILDLQEDGTLESLKLRYFGSGR